MKRKCEFPSNNSGEEQEKGHPNEGHVQREVRTMVRLAIIDVELGDIYFKAKATRITKTRQYVLTNLALFKRIMLPVLVELILRHTDNDLRHFRNKARLENYIIPFIEEQVKLLNSVAPHLKKPLPFEKVQYLENVITNIGKSNGLCNEATEFCNMLQEHQRKTGGEGEEEEEEEKEKEEKEEKKKKKTSPLSLGPDNAQSLLELTDIRNGNSSQCLGHPGSATQNSESSARYSLQNNCPQLHQEFSPLIEEHVQPQKYARVSRQDPTVYGSNELLLKKQNNINPSQEQRPWNYSGFHAQQFNNQYETSQSVSGGMYQYCTGNLNFFNGDQMVDGVPNEVIYKPY